MLDTAASKTKPKDLSKTMEVIDYIVDEFRSIFMKKYLQLAL